MQREHQDETGKQNEELKHALKEQIEALKAQVKLLLPDGRTVEDLQQEREEGVRNKVEVEQLWSYTEAEQGRRERRRTLLSEPGSIEGKWGRGKRRRQLLTELRGLDEAA